MEHYRFNPNKDCEYYPCHKGVDEEDFNCLFCYCPLYMLGRDCGGDFSLAAGIKDCSGCRKPHGPSGYEFILSRMPEVFQRTHQLIFSGEEQHETL